MLKTTGIGLLLLLSLALAAVRVCSAGSISVYKLSQSVSYAPSELLVKFRDGIDSGRINTILGQFKLTKIKVFEGISVLHLKANSGIDTVSTVSQLKQFAEVQYAEPNYQVHALQCATDPYVYTPMPVTVVSDAYYQGSCGGCGGKPLQWSLGVMQADKAVVHYGPSIAYGLTSTGVILAVIDTGVYAAHEDLQILTSSVAISKTMTGVNFTVNPPNSNTNDDNDTESDGVTYIGGHGTHVAGVAAATAGNSLGIAGIAANCRIMPIKALDHYGSGVESDIINAYLYAADNGAKVINCSFGGASYSQAEQDAILYAHNKGCIIVAASGNEGKGTLDYPAGYSYVIAVGSTDGCDRRAFYSNYGGGLSVVAPGGAGDTCRDGIISTANYSGTGGCLGDTKYSSLNGTSFAAPEVAGLAAVLASLKPAASAGEIQTIIERTADPVDGGTAGQWNTATGYGRVNVDRAIGYVLGSATVSPNTSPSGTRSYNYPNPFSPLKQTFTNIVFNVSKVEDVNIKIYDTSGALVWEQTVPANQVIMGWYNFLRWDGKNGNGQTVANGVYFYRITGGGLSDTAKIAVLR